ncbi:hypothetical protein [Mesoaciditoga lauensis]|uniref:hypothetical protein n=1 Tax=Mesoaciditoga lauensis TaxID=1495039 RepID=UPI00056AB950|nr:hypothetical protein [Mesoaciditoga lauensis]
MISLATQQSGETVFVYDETGKMIFARQGKLLGWTSSTVTIKVGNMAHVYDERGQLKFVRQVNQ